MTLSRIAVQAMTNRDILMGSSPSVTTMGATKSHKPVAGRYVFGWVIERVLKTTRLS
ncbi:MAG TPA: hypothetical protein VFV95_03480 [Vicinamibacterales bacterium]|nr:hypothetical protein [Vicinamibacterales bacterium]